MEPNKKQRWSIAEIYFYLICLITLLIFILATITGFFGVVKYVSPDKITSVSGEFGDYYDGEFGNYYVFREDMIAMSEETNNKNPPSEGEIKKAWELKKQENLKRIKNEGFTDSVKGLIAVIVIMPIFIIHWRKTRIYGKK